MQIEGSTSLRRLRERVAEWGIKPDRTGMIGCSAGAFFGGRRCHGPARRTAGLRRADRAAELHTFSRGEHGFGVARHGLPVDRWAGLLED